MVTFMKDLIFLGEVSTIIVVAVLKIYYNRKSCLKLLCSFKKRFFMTSTCTTVNDVACDFASCRKVSKGSKLM